MPLSHNGSATVLYSVSRGSIPRSGSGWLGGDYLSGTAMLQAERGVIYPRLPVLLGLAGVEH